MRISSIQKAATPGATAPNESDSNADTCCLGINFTVLSYTNRMADVYPYDSSYQPITNVPIVTGATTYHHHDGNSYILVINEALYYGDRLGHSLINPNQIRHHGIGYWDNPYDKRHQLSIEIYDHDLTIPLKYEGTKLVFSTALPSEDELNNLPHIELTSTMKWDPNNVTLGKVTSNQVGLNQDITSAIKTISRSDYGEVCEWKYEYNRYKVDDVMMNEVNPEMRHLKETLSTIYGVETPQGVDEPIPRNMFVSTDGHRKLDYLSLAENWGIGPIAELRQLC